MFVRSSEIQGQGFQPTDLVNGGIGNRNERLHRKNIGKPTIMDA
jgi:hypothetical protein